MDYKSTTIKQILNYIEDQSNYDFVYNNNDFNVEKKVNITMNNASIQEILDRLLEETGMGYKIVDHVIIIRPKEVNNFSKIEDQAKKTVTGKVTDSSDSPLPGVTVVVKGTTNGSITDSEGNYNLAKIPGDAILVFSFIGMKTQEIPMAGKTSINVTMIVESIGIDEVVAIGYGTKLKGELTGAISKINSDKLESRPVTGTMNALQGLISGVDITRTSGAPGQENFALTIRGSSSINGGTPLILVDGVPGDINLINPNDIQNVTVLKDASAAIYGARAADGVILITTKGGKDGKTVISYSGNVGVKSTNFLKKTTPTDHFVKMFNEANFNDGDSQTFSDATLAKIAANDAGSGPGENWNVESYPMWYQSKDYYGDLFKSSIIQSHNLSISGGNEKTTYFLSGSYLNNQGNISVGTNYSDKYNYRMNVQTKLRNNINLSAIVSYDYQNIFAPSSINNVGSYNQDNAIESALRVFSYVPEFNPAGNYYSYQGYRNPFQELTEEGSQTTTDSRLNNNLKIDWTPIKGLVWTGQAAVNIEHYGDEVNSKSSYCHIWDNSINGHPSNVPNSAYYNNWSKLYKNFSTYLNYDKILFDKHSIHLMAGASQESQSQNSRYMSGAAFLSNEIFVLPLSDPTNLSAGDYWNNNSWALLSYFGRFSYSFNGKYYLDATIRKDGSSKFSPERRWSGTYPSIAGAWQLSREPFFKAIVDGNALDLLKIRASWGRTGNQDIPTLGLFDYIQLISIGGKYPIDGSSISQLAASMNGIASPTRTWETIETKNLGFDLGFFHSKLNASFDVYQKENTNMLVSVAYPTTLGATAPSTNAGDLSVKGWDLQGNWKDQVGDFKFNVGFILDFKKNILTNLQGNDSYNLGLNFARQGYPLNSFFGYKGSIIRTQEELDAYASKFAGKGIVPGTQPEGYKGLGIGDVMYEDIDTDGKITSYGDGSKGSGDAVYLGSADPKYTYSVNAGLEYKNFFFNMILQGTSDKFDWRASENFGFPLAHSWFQPLDYYYGKTFSQDNINAQYPRLSNSGTVKSNNYQCSSIYLENTKYLRLKNITIGYNIPKQLLSTLNISSARVYFSGEDLLTISPGTWDKNYDPEESSNDFNYPFYKTFSFGLNVNF
ncbi:MAG: TonB-dependent receptor [Peptostreptococcaceae bacterium]|nr:TonB-dependent receptor [Peptostreptococcaceae bacterium]